MLETLRILTRNVLSVYPARIRVNQLQIRRVQRRRMALVVIQVMGALRRRNQIAPEMTRFEIHGVVASFWMVLQGPSTCSTGKPIVVILLPQMTSIILLSYRSQK